MKDKRKQMPRKIDSFLADLTPEGRDEFEEFVSSPNRLLRDIQAWWMDKDPVKYYLSTSAVHSWMKNHKAEGERTKIANAFFKNSRGVCAIAAMEASVTMMVVTAENRFKIAQDGEFREMEDINALVSTNRELRSSATALNQAQVRRDRNEDILSGAYELGRKMLTAAKDHANEKYVEELLAGELKAVEDELRREQLGDV